MKKLLYTLLVLFIAGLCISSSFHPVNFRKPGNNLKKGFAVIEFFTSEGCSSCPPADAVVADLQRQFPDNVFVLGFHVDYWNYLGWKDIYSDAAFGKRQQQYANRLAIPSIYTPQVVVNGEKEMLGSDKDKLQHAIHDALAIAREDSILLTLSSAEGNKLEVGYQFIGKEKAILNFALVQLTATSQVKNGENKGALLHHINVVRDFKTLKARDGATGKVTLSMPAGLTAKDFKVTAYAQEERTMRVTAAVSL